jgi:sporulation protein YlmC with PRC-barrel domain
MLETPTAELVGMEIVGMRGDKLGKVDELCFHGDGEDERWARVEVGLLGTNPVLVPLHDAEMVDGAIQVFYEKDHVRAAPDVDLEGDRISEDDAVLLHRHYGLEPVNQPHDEDDDEIELSREPREANPPGMEDDPAHPDNPITQRRRERAKELGVKDEG